MKFLEGMWYLLHEARHSQTCINVGWDPPMTRLISRHEEEGFCYCKRTDYVTKFGFPILDEASLDVLAKYSNDWLEVGCGIGYLAYEMRQRGMTVIATDPVKNEESNYHWCQSTPWISDIELLDAKSALLKYPGKNLIWGWPALDVHGNDYDLEAIKHFTGDYFALIGPICNGSYGTDEFREYISVNYTEVEYVELPSFELTSEALVIYAPN